MKIYKHKSLTIKAVGLGGIETCYILPEYQIAFDAGKSPDELIEIPTIFLTHGHLDHSAGIPYYFSQRSLRKLSAGKVYVPEKIQEPLAEILRLWQKIEDFTYPIQVLPQAHFESVQIRKDHFVQAIPSRHRVPSQGYALLRKSIKLKEEYLQLPGQTIKNMKDRGEYIFEERLHPLFVFSGDTTIEFLQENELAQTADVLLLECTYICEKRPRSRAREWGHIHLDEIIENLPLFKGEKLVLTHFSKRYSPKFVRKVVDHKVPPEFRSRVDLLLWEQNGAYEP